MPRWRQNRETGELTLVDSGHGGGAPRGPAILPDIEPFVSPIDRRVISSRSGLRRHNEEHDVVQHRELGENEGQNYFRRANKERVNRLTSQTAQDRRERIDALNRAYEHHRRR